jgi:hypothetical protein
MAMEKFQSYYVRTWSRPGQANEAINEANIALVV